MVSFTITPSALELIKKRLDQAPVKKPVVYLLETHGPFATPQDVQDAILNRESEEPPIPRTPPRALCAVLGVRGIGGSSV